MPARTSQLQIRVTEAEKAALRRLAGAAGMTVSSYVLARALPSSGPELAGLLEKLPAAGPRQRDVLERLAGLLSAISAEDLGAGLTGASLGGLSPLLANQVAALVEQAARAHGVAAPSWAAEVAPLARPYFGWGLASLRLHQIRVTPLAFKRRQVFFDPSRPRGVPHLDLEDVASGPQAPTEPFRRLAILDIEARQLELDVEFYFMGGAVLSQGFAAAPMSARAEAQLAPGGAVSDLERALAAREGWPADWAAEAVRGALVPQGGEAGTGGPAWIALGHVRAFVPRPEYVLGLQIAALGSDAGPRRLDDIRYVLRSLNVSSPAAALEIAGRYVSGRQIPTGAKEVLEALLAG